MRVEQFQKMESYTFAEGIAFLALVKAPRGVINHLKTTHNRSHLHSEIHKQLRIPRVKEIVRKNFDSTIARNPEIPKKESPTVEIPSARNPEIPKEESPSVEIPVERNPESTKEEDPSVEIPVERNPYSTKEEDPTEIILTKDDIRTHENTRLEDMPNDLCRTLWQKRQDVYREMQQAHLKMRAVPEGEEHNEERAHWREEVLRLDAENDAYWQQIDKEIADFKETQKKDSTPSESTIARNNESTKEESTPVESTKKENTIPSFDLSTYRAYISKALRKKKLTPEQLVELQHRVDAMIAAKVEMKQGTIEKLKAKGITVD